MTTDEQKYYENFFDMFLTDGWKQLMEDMDELHSSYTIENLSTVEELHKTRGERDVLRRLLNFQNGIEAAYASANEDNSTE